jgi:hypothetical protein
MARLFWLSLLLAIAGFAATPGKAADEPDLIFKRSTVFKLLTPNDKFATYCEYADNQSIMVVDVAGFSSGVATFTSRCEQTQ